MKILFLIHAFNSLSQRLFVELTAAGHEVSIELDINDDTTREAVDLFAPEVILAPYLRRAIPRDIWENHLCLILHPGIKGDRGPSALDWAILNDETHWGVTCLQAAAELDAGDSIAVARIDEAAPQLRLPQRIVGLAHFRDRYGIVAIAGEHRFQLLCDLKFAKRIGMVERCQDLVTQPAPDGTPVASLFHGSVNT